MARDLKANKQTAIDFYRTAFMDSPSKAVELYVGSEYIQHNPAVADGKTGIHRLFRRNVPRLSREKR